MEKLPEYIESRDGDLWFTENDRDRILLSYKVEEILAVEQSPFQHIMILDLYDYGPTLVLDGVVQSTSVDGQIYNEMITHIPMVAHPTAKNVLIIGGGDCGAAYEALKYPNVIVDMVEIDEAVVRLCRKLMPAVSRDLEDPRLNYLFQDGFKFIADSTDVYDVIIIDSSDPAGPAESLFTDDFYQMVKNAMKVDGIMICQSESPILYRETLRNTRASLKSIFKNVKTCIAAVPTYPGGIFSFTCASDAIDPSQWNGEWTLDTRYLNKDIYKAGFRLPKFIEELLA